MKTTRYILAIMVLTINAKSMAQDFEGYAGYAITYEFKKNQADSLNIGNINELFAELDDETKDLLKRIKDSIIGENKVYGSGTAILDKVDLKYYFKNDTMRIDNGNPFPKFIIYIPKTFSKCVQYYEGQKTSCYDYLFKPYSNFLSLEYEVEKIEGDDKLFFGYLSNKYLITETSNIISEGVHETQVYYYELYVAKDFSIPIHAFLPQNFKKEIPINGFMMQARIWEKGDPNTIAIVKLISFNQNKQDSSLIKIPKID